MLSFECASRGYLTSIKSGTVIEGSNLPIRDWMMAITFITATKKGFNSAKLQRQLEMKRYEPVFRLYHKIRLITGKRDDCYRLEDKVEYDEAFVGKSTQAKV